MESVKDKNFNNALNCLIYNERLSRLITETVKNIDRTIHSLTDSQEYISSHIISEDDIKTNYVSQMINGENMCRVRKPFFSANNGLIPFTNNVEKGRLQDGSYDYYLLKHQLQKLCTETQYESLRIAIGKNVYDIKHEQLIKSRDKNALKKLKTLNLTSLRDLSNECDEELMDRIDWMTISSQDLNGQLSPVDCRRLWDKVFNPEYVYTKWTESESKTLLQLASELGCQGKWMQIASQMPTKRQPFVCFKRWLELTSKMETSEEWTKEEDEHLCEVVDQTKDRHGNRKGVNWNKVALLVPNRSVKDCEKRWNSFQLAIVNRQFSDDDDYQLLLLIKKIGMDNWVDVAREMNQRTVEQCQRRYCEIVEELHPWSYFEDRKLWLVLRSYFRNMWNDSIQMMDTTMNLTIYKSVINGFNGRCPLVLRHRYVSLCKWFSLWDKFYQILSVKGQKNQRLDSTTTSLLSADSCEEKSHLINKILKIILRTSFFNRICYALSKIGSKDPDTDANELVTQCKNGDSSLLNKLIKESPNQKLMDLLLFIIDLQNGIFIPTKFEDYINRSCVGIKYPQRAHENLRVLSSNVRNFECKTALSTTLRKGLNALLNDSSVYNSDKNCIQKMLECEGKFISALNFAVAKLEKTHQFKFACTVDLLEKFLPQFLRLMIRYIYSQERPELSTNMLHLNNMLTNKQEQIAELLIYRDAIPCIYNTYLSSDKKAGCLSTMYLSKPVINRLMKEDRIILCYKNSFKILKSQQQFPLVDNVVLACPRNCNSIVNDIPLLPPNKCSLNLLRSFILQKQRLVNIGKTRYSDLVRLRYDNPTKYLQSDTTLETSLAMDKSSILLCDPRYILLRSRLLSVLSIPSIVARISPFACAFTADKLHEEQNNVESSTEISDAFNNVNSRYVDSDLEMDTNIKESNSLTPINRKRKILSSVDDDMIPLIEGHTRQVTKISHHQPLTRRIAHTWIKLLVPTSKSAFFVQKDIFQSCLKDNFDVVSINGVPVTEFLN